MRQRCLTTRLLAEDHSTARWVSNTRLPGTRVKPFQHVLGVVVPREHESAVEPFARRELKAQLFDRRGQDRIAKHDCRGLNLLQMVQQLGTREDMGVRPDLDKRRFESCDRSQQRIPVIQHRINLRRDGYAVGAVAHIGRGVDTARV